MKPKTVFPAAITCNRPVVPQNGNISRDSSSYRFAEVVSFACNNGFRISGNSNTSCVRKGWSVPSPLCNGELRLNQVDKLTLIVTVV